jgi:hypothetical protein
MVISHALCNDNFQILSKYCIISIVEKIVSHEQSSLFDSSKRYLIELVEHFILWFMMGGFNKEKSKNGQTLERLYYMYPFHW